MKVSTPAISWHNRERISSVDFQPICYPPPSKEKSRSVNRIASGGDDKHVVIWDISVAEQWSGENKNECGKVEPVCLCDLSRHQNTVNIVRWSPNGQILASGDSDSVVFLWHYQDESFSSRPDIFDDVEDGPNGEGSSWAESWGVLKILRGHLQDVVGLAWSPCSTLLASCSTDATTIVFDINKGSKLKILGDHKGWVNGVAWARTDPFSDASGNGKGNLATLASDRCLRVYNTSTKNFKNIAKTHRCKLKVPVTKKVSEDECNKSQSPAQNEQTVENSDIMVDVRNVRLFHDDTFPSFYRRLDFSPDGELLVVPSGVLDIEGETADAPHTTLIFCTTNYSKPVVYLPGKEFSVATRFSPMKYELRPVARINGIKKENIKEGLNSPDEKLETNDCNDLKPWEKYQTIFCLPYRMIYAVATQNSIMLYDTQQAEPFARITRLHYIGLNDLTWSSDGNTLVVSSTDGYCSIINFKQGELGQIYQPQDVLNQENDVTNGHNNQEISKQDSKSIKCEEERPASEIETNPCNNTVNATKHEHESEKEIHLSNSSEFTKIQNASTKEEPMEVDVDLLQNNANERNEAKRRCSNNEAVTTPNKNQPPPNKSETTVLESSPAVRIKDQLNNEKPRKRIQLITLSSSVTKKT